MWIMKETPKPNKKSSGLSVGTCTVCMVYKISSPRLPRVCTYHSYAYVDLPIAHFQFQSESVRAGNGVHQRKCITNTQRVAHDFFVASLCAFCSGHTGTQACMG